MDAPQLPAGFSVRPVTIDDVEAVTALIVSTDVAEEQDAWITAIDVREDLLDPALDWAGATWFVEDDATGALAAYGEVWNTRDPATPLEVQAFVAPDYRERGLGTYLLDSFDATAALAAQEGSRTGDGAVIRNYVTGSNPAAAAMLTARGYTVVRHFFHMVIDLAPGYRAPEPPPGVTVRGMDPDSDRRAVFELIEHAFAEHWGWTPLKFDVWWKRMSGRADFDPDLNVLAFSDDRLIGVSVNQTKLDQGWIADLGVRREARRKGLGELLLRHSFERFSKKGWDKVGLGVDSANATGAVRLYERVGMEVSRRYDAYERRLTGGS